MAGFTAFPHDVDDFKSARLAKHALAIATGAAILTIPALWNGFPFIFPDTGDYLVFHPLLHRSPCYGLFIFFFHLNRFIWGPIIARALIATCR